MIDGVKIIELSTHSDERGYFREIIRFPDQFNNVPVGQLSHGFVNEGVIKAWHGHKFQSQWNYVVSGQIKVVLVDNRVESATYKQIIKFVSGDNVNSIAYYFPPNVMHGYKCLKGPMQIIYVTSGVYDLEDEIRLTSDELSIEFNFG